MKKIMYLAVLLVSLSAAATTPPEVNEKVIKAFKETFSTAENVKWDEAENNCRADFNISEIRVSAIYDNEGNLLKTTRYYGGSNLLPNILARIKKEQSGKEIFGVTEITTEEDVSFHIVLKDEKNWYWMKSDVLGNMQLTKKYKRGEPREVSGF